MTLTWKVPSRESVCVQIIRVLKPQEGFCCTSLVLIVWEKLPLDRHVGDKAWERHGDTRQFCKLYTQKKSLTPEKTNSSTGQE